MKCTTCGYPDTQVVDTKHNEIKNFIYRRRECLRCGLRFNTHESYKELDNPSFNKAQNRNIT